MQVNVKWWFCNLIKFTTSLFYLPQSDCVALQDPYCAWDKIGGKCASHGAPRWTEETFYYSQVSTGQHSACPSGKTGKKDVNYVESKGYRDDFDIRGKSCHSIHNRARRHCLTCIRKGYWFPLTIIFAIAMLLIGSIHMFLSFFNNCVVKYNEI